MCMSAFGSGSVEEGLSAVWSNEESKKRKMEALLGAKPDETNYFLYADFSETDS